MTDWAVILGASSGFGAATARQLSSDGLNIFGVHLDRRTTMPIVEAVKQDIQASGQKAIFFNANAAQEQARIDVIAQIKNVLSKHSGSVRVLLHSLAFGNLLPYLTAGEQKAISISQMDMTFSVMAHSLVYWVRDLVDEGLMGDGGRVYAMTSAGNQRIWPHYGAVSAVKSTLDAHVRRLAFETAPYGITVNSIRAGVTDTPALRRIPGNDELIEHAKRVNPSGRLTTPKDVAEAISALMDPRTHWITGNIIGTDGGEDLVG
jgi:NAD(P)-dependent dehydrogenase (short-subunit alcohol dehydrogenase family)